MEPWGTGTHIIPLRLLRRKLNALTPFVASTYPCKDMLQKNMHAGRHCKKSNSVWRVTFDYPLHPHTAHTHTHNLMVPSDITVSHFKEFGSEHSYVWYLKHPPKVLRVSSSHTHTLYTLTHTHTHTHSLAPQQKYTDWSQWRAIERKSEKIQKEWGRFFPPFEDMFNGTFIIPSFLYVTLLVLLVLLTHYNPCFISAGAL